jgi:pantoate--beta-alanine ligase
LKKGGLISLKKQAVNMLIEKSFKVDYVEIAEAGDLRIADQWDGKQKLVALSAAHLNHVRLIDNILLN